MNEQDSVLVRSLIVILDDGPGVAHVGSLIGVLTAKYIIRIQVLLLFVHGLGLRHVGILAVILRSSIGVHFSAIALVLPVGLLLDAAHDSHFDVQRELGILNIFVVERIFVLWVGAPVLVMY